jgi:HAD superfamily phosphoserine phosphatase-like hydrolase
VQLEKGKITLEECIQKIVSMLDLPKHLILKELEQVTFVRPSFKYLVDYCKTQKIPLFIVSAGLDFIIEHFLEPTKWGDLLKIHAAKTSFTNMGIQLTFPALLDKTSLDFKEDLVKHQKKQGRKAIYIGDGNSDYRAVKKADFVFAIRGSELATLCKRSGILHREINDFKEVVDAIKESIFS